ncbi:MULTISPECIES: SDR family oxidoreductase [unclassified Streptomyces]|uniref:SDR family oxidoreductase n=1 Tax=unclassified Streptomyces TaxID=2593676 RepID=UPI0033BE148F
MGKPHGRVAIITGAGDVVGTAAARAAARLGFTVAAVDRKAALCNHTLDALDALGRPGRAFEADVTLAHEAEATVGRVCEELGPPSALVNNPQFAWSAPHIPSASEDDWDTVLRVNLRAAFLMSRAVEHHLVRQGSGRIVNVASAPSPDTGMRAAIATARAGLHGFSRVLAAELGPFGVTVNTVIPGYIETKAAQVVAARHGLNLVSQQKDAAMQAPLGRTTSPEDVGDAVRYFLSDVAHAISGQFMALADGHLA